MTDCEPCKNLELVLVDLPDDYDLGGFTFGELKAWNESSRKWRLVSIEESSDD